jgi:2-dehydro-3-deoxyphosphooctonate aldolase (KDO 8-P synthase)
MTARRTFDLLGRTFGAEGRLFLIAGPDLAEPRDLCLRVAERVRAACERLDVPFIFKGSFDKANRTSAEGYRGPGLEAGLATLAAVRAQVGVPVLTDVHEVAQVAPAAEVADVLQVPAFLCRQTDLVQACARTGKPVNVKKGQFLAPEDMHQVVKKIEAAGGRAAILTERGTTFGYRMLVNDLRAIPIMQASGYPVCYDATHSQQIPAGRGGSSGGVREMIGPMARAAVAAGADGCFFEVHEDPASSKVDPDTHLPIDALEPLLVQLVAIKRAASA